MILAFGIIMILVGIFAFRQGSTLSVVARLFQSSGGSELSEGWILAAALMILGGILCVASNSGKKRSMVTGGLICFIAAALVEFFIGVGDLKLYAWVSAITALIVTMWLIQTKEEKEEEPEQKKSVDLTKPIDQPSEPNEEPEEPIRPQPPRNN